MRRETPSAWRPFFVATAISSVLRLLADIHWLGAGDLFFTGGLHIGGALVLPLDTHVATGVAEQGRAQQRTDNLAAAGGSVLDILGQNAHWAQPRLFLTADI